jgi:glycosyltransferase involved in cell wall biosynthesis
MDSVKTILYVGIYPPKAPRDKVYIEELKKRGVGFVECIDDSRGFVKFKSIWRKIKAFKGDYDLIWAGYLSGVFVPMAYLAGRKKIIYNALGSAYEAYVLDRAVCGKYSFRAFLFWLSDFLAFHLSTTILVESEAQKKYLAKNFFVSQSKFRVIFTGVDEVIFHPDPSVKKHDVFTVVFRGQFIPATGVEYVLETAKLLKNEPIRFLIIGWGQLKDDVVRYISANKLDNVELITVFQSPDELRKKILECHVMLGAFSDNPRLDRTIQHKTGEALALGMPYITRDSISNRELLTDGVDCLFVAPENPEAIAGEVRFLIINQKILNGFELGARHTYEEKLASIILGERVHGLLKASIS